MSDDVQVINGITTKGQKPLKTRITSLKKELTHEQVAEVTDWLKTAPVDSKMNELAYLMLWQQRAVADLQAKLAKFTD